MRRPKAPDTAVWPRVPRLSSHPAGPQPSSLPGRRTLRLAPQPLPTTSSSAETSFIYLFAEPLTSLKEAFVCSDNQWHKWK